MATAKILTDGNTQILVIPEEFHLNCTEVEVTKAGTEIKLAPKSATSAQNEKPNLKISQPDTKIADFLKTAEELGGFTDDVLNTIEEARKNETPVRREEL